MTGRLRRSTRWRARELAALDFETTGLDRERDHVISFGIVPISRARIHLSGALYGVVRPPAAIPSGAIRVHGLRPSDLADAPSLDEVAGEVKAALEGRVIVAHAAWLELGFLGRLPGRPLRRLRAVDVLDLAGRLAALEGGPAPPARLADLAGAYGIPPGRPHHAFSDALVTAQLFLILAAGLERHGLDPVGDLYGDAPGWRRHVRRPS